MNLIFLAFPRLSSFVSIWMLLALPGFSFYESGLWWSKHTIWKAVRALLKPKQGEGTEPRPGSLLFPEYLPWWHSLHFNKNFSHLRLSHIFETLWKNEFVQKISLLRTNSQISGLPYVPQTKKWGNILRNHVWNDTIVRQHEKFQKLHCI